MARERSEVRVLVAKARALGIHPDRIQVLVAECVDLEDLMTAIEEEALGLNTPLARALRCGTSFLDEPWSD